MRKTWFITLILLIGLAAGSYGLFLYLSPPKLPEGVIYGNGRIEGDEINIASEVTGRILESNLVEGKSVKKGDLLIRVEDKDLKIQLEQAKASYQAVVNDKARLQEELRTARHHQQNAETDINRYRKLKTSGAVSVQRTEEAENAYQEARGSVTSLEARLAEIASRLEAADQSIKLIESQLTKTSILAPGEATVLVKAVEPGEFVSPGKRVAQLIDLSRLELKVYVPEADIGRIKLGDSARVRIDAFPDRYLEAKVTRIDQQAQFTPRDIHMPAERVSTVFGVTLALDNPAGELKPGMPADAWILWKEGTSWPQTLVVPK